VALPQLSADCVAGIQYNSRHNLTGDETLRQR
jgi:hypothetical protein